MTRTGRQEHASTSGTIRRGRFFAWVRLGLIAVVGLPLISLGGGWLWLIVFPPDLASHIPQLSRHFAERTGLDLHLGNLTLNPGLSLILEGRKVRLSIPAGEKPVLEAEGIRLRFSPLQWFRGWPALSVVLDGPELNMRRDGQGGVFLGAYPLEHLMANKNHTSTRTTTIPLPVQHVALTHAKVSWIDDATGVKDEGRAGIRLQELSLDLFLEPEGILRVNLEGALVHPEGNIPLNLSTMRDRNGDWRGELVMDRLSLPSLGLHLGTVPPLGDFSAAIDARMTFEWQPSANRFQGQWTAVTGTAELNLPRLFRDPIPVKKGEAKGSWVWVDHLWDLKVTRWSLHNADGKVEGRLELTGMGGQKPLIDLDATLKGIPTDQAKVYYPAHVMNQKLVKWLERSLHGGTVQQARVRIKGPIGEIPFANPPAKDDPETVFTIDGEVRGLDLTFHPALPDLANSTAKVAVDRLGINIQVAQAAFVKNRQVRGRVRIGDMVHQPIVEVEAHLPEVDLESTWNAVMANPNLQWDKAAGLQGMKIHGPGKATLSLLLPLTDLKRSWFGGTLEFDQAVVKPAALEAPLEQVQGRLALDPHRLTLELPSGRMQNKPVSLEVDASFYREPGKAQLQGKIKTVIGHEELETWFAPLLGREGSFQGEAPFTLEFNRPAGKEMFNVVSVLRANGLTIQGGLGWFKPEGSSGTVTMEGVAGLQGPLEIKLLQLDLGNLSLMGRGNWHLKSGKGDLDISKFRLNDHQGALSITQSIPKGAGPGDWKISADLSWLNLAPVFDKKEPQNHTSPQRAKRRVDWPKVDVELHAREFALANNVRGKGLAARMTLDNHRMSLKQLKGTIDGTGHRITGELRWEALLGSGPYEGGYVLESDDIGRLFHGWDIQEAFMQEGQAVLELSLKGFLPPGRRLKHHLSGTAEFTLTRGTISRLGILSQVLGVFSLKDLPNLVFMDRPDLIANGFRYDRIQGQATLKRSVATLEKLNLEGPSMNMMVSGTIHFPKKQLNLLLGIRPIQTLDRIISNVPVLGTLVAGDREAVLETLFDINGSMDEPQVSIRPVASIIPGIVRDMLTKPDDSMKESVKGANTGSEEAVP